MHATISNTHRLRGEADLEVAALAKDDADAAHGLCSVLSPAPNCSGSTDEK